VTPDEEFTIAFRRMNNGWAIIHSLRMVSTAGMPYAAKVVEVEQTSLVSDLTISGDLKKFIIGIVDDDDLKKTADFLSQKLTEQTLKNASSSVDAASLLFAHSVLEDGLNSFLEITSDVAPEFWKDRVKKKPFDLEAVMKRGLDDVVASFVREKIWSIRRSESLINKTDLLVEICKPSGPPSNPNYKFDAVKLKSIDKLRQNIVHGDLLGAAIADINEKLEYLRNTWMYFFMLMHERFGLRLDPTMLTSQPGRSEVGDRAGPPKR
jgi:hypothetical protein